MVKNAKKKCLLGLSTTSLRQADYPNHVWSHEFVYDLTADGRTLKCLTVVGEYTRGGLAIHPSCSIMVGEVVTLLQTLFELCGTPSCIKSDNGPELVARCLHDWLRRNKVGTYYIDPGSPWQSGHNESLIAVFRDSCLNRWVFSSVHDPLVIG